MSDIAIKVENISKRYRIGMKEELHDTFVGSMVAWLKLPLANYRRLRSLTDFSGNGGADDIIWALKDVSFEIKHGEVMGIIGRNGAGKSTLLKILSRITEPTSGKAFIHGRVASLLEVGTGFHPDLTGRENVYLNGTILGMKKSEIDLVFEEIVNFSEVEKYIDTPVKRYSSGMTVRLAFAVAAHLKPEIMLIDEVLAVGDVAFQKKCLTKMEGISQEGRTILFVSHNMQSIRALCPRSILIQEGRIETDSKTPETLSKYYEVLRQVEVTADTDINNPNNRRGSGAVRITGISMQDESDAEIYGLTMGSMLKILISYEVYSLVEDLFVSIVMRSGITGETVTSTKFKVSEIELLKGYKDTLTIKLPEVILRPGEYPLYFWLGNSKGRPYDVVDNITAPLIIYSDGDFEELGYNPSQQEGYFNIKSELIQNT